MDKKLFVLIGIIFVSTYNLLAQTLMPLPAHSAVYSGSPRGYWFVAPTAFTITGLRVAAEAGTGTQAIQVMKCHDPLPVAFTAQSSNFTALYYVNNAPNGVIQTVNIPVAAGDTIGILGTVGVNTNSYSASIAVTSTIGTFPVSLNRFGYQSSINLAAAPAYWGEAMGSVGQISRVEMYYTTGPPVPPNCVSTPLAPANNATSICSGTTVLRWNKVTNATGYDVYFNTGGTATALVATNQTDTFYTATTGVGLHSWKVVPRNASGLATGCNAFNFTTIPGITPTASITVSPNDSICVLVPATFTATITNGGTAPIYQWKKNNVNVGTNSPTFTDNSIANNDNYKVVITSNSTGCLTSATATSNQINMYLLPTPVTTITAAGPTAFCMGGAVTLNATAGAASYQWLNGNSPIANATNSSFVAMYNGFYKVQVLGSGNACPSISDSIKVTVYQNPFPLVNRNGNVLSTSPAYASYQWYKGIAPISGATSNTFSFTNDGQYSVKVTDTAGCSGSSVYVPVNNLSVSGAGTMPLKVYPNPGSDIVVIAAPMKMNIAVRSLDGRLVLEQEHTNEINISHLANGVYILSVMDNNNHLIGVERLVKNAH